MSKKELWSKIREDLKDKPVVLASDRAMANKININHQLDAYRYMVQALASSPVPKNQPAAHPMLVFNKFDQYPLQSADGWSINGLTTPTKYMPNTYGYCKVNGGWYKLILYRDKDKFGVKDKGAWRHKWDAIPVEQVPREHQAACVLLSQFI
jgi:hypothetical protein